MPSKSLRRTAASLSLAVCLSLLHTPAAHAKARTEPARGRQAQARPAGLLVTAWHYLIVVLTGQPPLSDQGATADPNGAPLSDQGATADPNGLRRIGSR
jgi:hypothetical protein